MARPHTTWLQSHGFQVNHPKFREQGHNKEGSVEEQQADAVGLAELEALQGDGHQGEGEAEPQGAGQHPVQQSVGLQLWETNERAAASSVWLGHRWACCLGHLHVTPALETQAPQQGPSYGTASPASPGLRWVPRARDSMVLFCMPGPKPEPWC